MMVRQVLLSFAVLAALPFIMIGMVRLTIWLSPQRRPATAPPPPLPRRPSKKDPAMALKELKPRIEAKEEELGALRAEEFRLSMEAGRVRDPYRGGVTDDCVQMPALTDGPPVEKGDG